MATSIVIFCDDFRIKDNPALFHASQEYEKIIPLFVFDENYLGRKIGSAAKVFLHHVLKSFDELLREKYDVKLILRKGDVVDEINKIKAKTKVDAIYFNRSYCKKQIEAEEKIAKEFSNLDVKSFKAKLLFEPSEIKTLQDSCFKVFTPFSAACLKKADLVGEFLTKPKTLKSVDNIDSLNLSDLNLLPKNEGKWHLNLIKNWQFDYEKIAEIASDFLSQKLENYAVNRNMTDSNGNSGLSPYLRFGMVSPRIIFNAARNYEHHRQFVLELLWREFAYHVSYYNPEIASRELKEEYKNFEWEDDSGALEKWKKGETGFDIVDAGMKEIRQTGAMHNRVRMIVASFMIKDLLVDWREGEKYFWDCLVDADVAINPFSWQWVFGSGFDAAPYFRIFNPDLQQEKYDPEKNIARSGLVGVKKFRESSTIIRAEKLCLRNIRK